MGNIVNRGAGGSLNVKCKMENLKLFSSEQNEQNELEFENTHFLFVNPSIPLSVIPSPVSLLTTHCSQKKFLLTSHVSLIPNHKSLVTSKYYERY